MAQSPTRPPSDRLVHVWIALAVVFALFIGTGAGILGWLSGQVPAAAILTGGVAFGGTVTLGILVINVLSR